MTGPAESDEDREAQGVHADGEGATGPRAHDAAKIAGSAAVTDHQSRVRVSYDAVTDAYVDRVHDELRHKPLDRALLTAFAEQLQETFGAGAPVCDAGCGPGHVGAFLGRLGLEITGIDLSPAMVARARELHPELAFEVGTMTALAAPDGRWRGLIAFYSIIHLTSDAEIRAALREFQRTVAEGSLILVAVHVGEHGDAIVHSDEMLGVGVDMDFRFFDVDWLVAEMAAAGFAVEARLMRGPYPDVEVQTTRAYLLGRRLQEAAGVPPKAPG
jgi:SAM-dependent methyltransferase